jgi:capsular exopolysaccharide synthesis family protein
MQGLRTLADVDLGVAHLRNTLRIDVGRRDEIITISFDSPYAIEAAQIVNNVVDAYMASRSDHERQNSGQVLEILQEEMARATKELNERRDEFEEFQSSGMPLALGSDQGSDVVPRYLGLEGHLTQAQMRASEAESFLAGVKALSGNPVALRQYLTGKGYISIYAGASRERAPLEADLSEARRQREDLLEELTPDNPRVRKAESEIKRITASLAELDSVFVNAALATAEQELQEAKREEEEVSKLFDEQRTQVTGFYAEVAKYQRLNDEVTELATYCQTVQQQIRDIRTIIGEDVGHLRMAILETALPAQIPSWPQKTKVMAVALILGLLGGGGLAVLRDLLDQTLRSGDEVSTLLGLPILGVVPAMPRRQKTPIRGQRVRLQPDSPEAEAFRTVRTAVFFGAPKEKAKTLLVTSPASGDGKSTLVSNLAIAMAQAGQKTLVLDADFRRPMQHVIFGLEHTGGGLSAVLTGEMELEQAIQATAVEGLGVLPCGPNVRNPSETLNSHRFSTLLQHLAKVYDRVVVDAPPVTVVTDAQILGAVCDVTILVLRAHKSTRKIGQRAMGSLYSVGAHLLGAVVNDVPRNGDTYGYYGKYGGSNGRGQNDRTVGRVAETSRNRGSSHAAAKASSQRAELGNTSR